MSDNNGAHGSHATEFQSWYGWLAAFVGAIAATNLVLFGLVGQSRTIFAPSKRLGYELGTGLGLGLGLALVLYLLILRRAPRKWTVLAFVVTTLAGTLAMHFVGGR